MPPRARVIGKAPPATRNDTLLSPFSRSPCMQDKLPRTRGELSYAWDDFPCTWSNASRLQGDLSFAWDDESCAWDVPPYAWGSPSFTRDDSSYVKDDSSREWGRSPPAWGKAKIAQPCPSLARCFSRTLAAASATHHFPASYAA